MSDTPTSKETSSDDSAVRGAAARYLPAWETGDLPDAPRPGWRLWIGLLGPGVVLAGTSVGTGEWLFGPGVTAQYGPVLLWMALTSIIFQLFCNLMFMRYAVYCGEPIIVGTLRTWPGPKLWMVCFAILDFTSIWPYNAANAAVPVFAAIFDRLPHGAGDGYIIKALAFGIFLLAFVPLVFGGTVYRMLEKIMTFKLVVVLAYLSVIAICLVSWGVIGDVVKGFFQFGQVPLRAETIVVERHFTITKGNVVLRGTFEEKGDPTDEFVVTDGGEQTKYTRDDRKGDFDAAKALAWDELLAQARRLSRPGKFFVSTKTSENVTLSASGDVVDHHHWLATELSVEEHKYTSLDKVPEPHAGQFRQLLNNEGVQHVNLAGYVAENGRLPPLDWAMIVGFIGIAGAGAMTNTMFSNYARDKGWGMGQYVGAIPSAVGGRTIGLSHTGRALLLGESNLSRWRGWMRHITRDQWIWMAASIVGMALPCMMSLEFIRNATVTGDRVTAMSAEGIAQRYPDLGGLFWYLTLLCGFLILAPGQVSASDQIARRWTDMIWTAGTGLKRAEKRRVKIVYYGILCGYAVWGTIVIWTIPTVTVAKIGAVLGNIALGVTALQALYVNRKLMPKELQPRWHLKIGTVLGGVFFIAVGVACVFVLF
ncbi:MAG: Nramp family divalent metal transporter [Planctomycetia bacterium]|nr:Nramp family divalent metal transporter [Planctomycetia bacterium]